MFPPVSDQLDQDPRDSGTVVRLWRYPVKSMLGERCVYLDLNARGVVGDRLFAIRTVEGKFGSGKSTRRFRSIAGLFGFQATYQDDIPEVTFPDGRIVRGDDLDMHTHLSNALGQPVTLAIEEAISHVDAGPVHLLTTAALAWLQTRLDDSVIMSVDSVQTSLLLRQVQRRLNTNGVGGPSPSAIRSEYG